jgi:suppressor for copper-sensitivity B
MRLLVVLITILLFGIDEASAVQVKFEFNSDTNVSITLHAKADEGWKVSAQDPGDIGVPFLIELRNPKNIADYHINWPKNEVVEEIIGNDSFRNNYYKDEFDIKLDISPINTKEPVEFDLYMQYGLCNDVCLQEEVMYHVKQHDGVITAVQKNIMDVKETSELGLNIIQIILFAAIGGLILNFMPCVLPVLGIKILTLVKAREAKALSLVTALGIIISFLVFGVITIFLKYTGEAVGWGLHFQNEYFILALIMLLVAMASNYYGDYEISLPRRFGDVAGIDLKNQYLNSFISGVIAVILATPCTAPFLSASVALALSGTYAEVIATFLAIGVGMASPFLVVLVAPQLLKFLPKPGRWMEMLKKVFALFFLATAIWLLNILALRVGIYWVLGLAFSIFVLRVGLKSAKARSRIKIVLLFIAVWFLALFLSSNNLEHYDETTTWEKFSEITLGKALKADRVVLVNVTAKWCLTCKLNELRVLDDEDLLGKLQEENVLLLKADYTFEDPAIRDYIKKHNRSGIPLTVVYGPKNKHGVVLSEILDTASVLDAVKKNKK